MKLRTLLVSLFPLALLACQGTPGGGRDLVRFPAVEGAGGDENDEAPPWAAPPLTRSISVYDGRTREPLAFADLLDRLAGADAVFLGETHIDETTHRVEHAVYQGLLERRDGHVVLAMEMFERDAQDELDAYLAGQIDEEEFRATAGVWGNYQTAYRTLIETAKRAGAPVVASNFPRSLRRRVAMEGEEILQNLEGDDARLAPAEYFANTPEYWRRVDNAVRGHIGMMGIEEGDDERLFATQSLWDNAMGEACALALDAHPGSSVLHVNGGFHSEYWDGTVRQFALRKPDADVLTVSIQTSWNPNGSRPWGEPVADYVVFAESRASDLNDGFWSVGVRREVKYLFHLPERATWDEPVPLLIWLSDDGLAAADGLRLWKDRLGDEAAICVLEAPYRETQADLAEGGRWFWPDSFPSDMGVMTSATARAWGYLMRHYPLDPERVAIAGEGTGATVVAAVSLLSGHMEHEAVAFAPRQYAKIKDFPLPLPEYRGDEYAAEKSLVLHLDEADEEWWTSELAEYESIGFSSSWSPTTDDPWSHAGDQENALREALDLSPAPQLLIELPRRYLLVEENPRARHWARLEARHIEAAGEYRVAVVDRVPMADDAEELPLELSPSDLSVGQRIPRCPGPFGGSTVLVVPQGASDEELAAWHELEENDPLNARSRFHRVRIATGEAERTLPEVLEKLRARDRKNVLIVPAEFAADGDTMRALKKSVREFEDRMTLQWRPGLGGLDRD